MEFGHSYRSPWRALALGFVFLGCMRRPVRWLLLLLGSVLLLMLLWVLLLMLLLLPWLLLLYLLIWFVLLRLRRLIRRSAEEFYNRVEKLGPHLCTGRLIKSLG